MNPLRASKLAAMAKKFSDPLAILAKAAVNANSDYDRATVLLALTLAGGSLESIPASQVWSRAGAIVRAYMGQQGHDPGSHPTGLSSDPATVTDYSSIIPPSDEARKQARDKRKATGEGEYKGNRRIRPRSDLRGLAMHDSRLPAHW